MWAREEKKDYSLKEGEQLFDGEVVRVENGKVMLGRKGDAGEPREVVLSLKAQ